VAAPLVLPWPPKLQWCSGILVEDVGAGWLRRRPPVKHVVDFRPCRFVKLPIPTDDFVPRHLSNSERHSQFTSEVTYNPVPKFHLLKPHRVDVSFEASHIKCPGTSAGNSPSRPNEKPETATACQSVQPVFRRFSPVFGAFSDECVGAWRRLHYQAAVQTLLLGLRVVIETHSTECQNLNC